MSATRRVALRFTLCAVWLSAAGCAGSSEPGPGGGAVPSSITHGKDLDETNTGVEPGVTLRPYTGPKVEALTQDWLDTYNGGSKLIEGMLFDHVTFKLIGDSPKGITFRNCRFLGTGGSSPSMVFNTDYLGYPSGAAPADINLILEHVEFDGGDDPSIVMSEGPVAYHGFTLRRCRFHRWGNAIRVGGGNVVIEETLIHDMVTDPAAADPHQAGIGAPQGTEGPITITRSKIFPGPGATGLTAAIAFLTDNLGGPVTITDNALQDGAYALYVGWAGNSTYTGNIFYRDHHARSGYYGPVTGGGSQGGPGADGIVWSNNTWGPYGVADPSTSPAPGSVIEPP